MSAAMRNTSGMTGIRRRVYSPGAPRITAMKLPVNRRQMKARGVVARRRRLCMRAVKAMYAAATRGRTERGRGLPARPWRRFADIVERSASVLLPGLAAR